MALPFPKGEGEVGCEALSSSQHEPRQSNNMRADDAETPPGGHAETANRQPQKNKALLQRSFTLQPLLARSEQDAARTATHHQAINQSLCQMHQQPATAAAGKNCFCTSNFHSEMHPATRFQNLTHLRLTQKTQK